MIRNCDYKMSAENSNKTQKKLKTFNPLTSCSSLASMQVSSHGALFVAMTGGLARGDTLGTCMQVT